MIDALESRIDCRSSRSSCSGGIGKRHDEQAIDIANAVENHVDDALDEDGGFARAGGGRNEQVFAMRFDCFGLIGSPTHAITSPFDARRSRR
mgnify:CR=1 FL=1